MRTVLSVCLLALLVHVNRNAECGDREWLPFEDDDGFGYREWRCQLRPGHPGKHEGWLR